MGRDELLSASDGDLLAAMSRGNTLAFDTLYNRYWKDVYNIAYKRLQQMDLAQDVAQDVFVQLWTREKSTPIDNLGGYLRIATRNCVFKQMEKSARQPLIPDPASFLEELKETGGTADDNMLYKEFLAAFQALTATLPAQQQLIFNMRFHEGRSSQEIADELQLSVKTVRNQMGKALSKLRESLILLQIALIIAGLK
ncbi:RNA polymerase sigma factor [Chitinophaga sp. Cy-1792]|uniref:RNA polymerase sigma factor n=1 Tax=Chitinophaga sp. Cy-1792 TaxID=2608339 RepID=UPI0014249988|nr:sigma-70 family RNA polymerase sigma factor [Chitinophaga sp. Cy-1792]NIG57577.1 sigma-70 family RNA polymerase sigma factor [Chitinophaga sp. Cy-1792]